MNNILSPHIDPNKIFIINRSEIEGRLDPLYLSYFIKHKPKFRFKTIRLNKLAKSFSGGTPSKEIKEFWNGDICWVSPKDFKGFYISNSEDKITEKGLKESSTRLVPERSVLMVVRSGVLLHTLPVAINTVPVTINQDVKAFITNDIILPEYLAYFFKIFNDISLRALTKHSTTVQSVNSYELERLEISVPPLSYQKEIISFLDQAHILMQQKEDEAIALLAGIDDYLLGELGIILPEMDNSLQNRIFTTQFSDVMGNRIDPKLYDNNTQSLRRAIRNTHIHTSKLRDLVIHSISGDWGEEEISDGDYTKCLVVRATEFDNDYNLNLDNTRVKHRFIRNDKLLKMDMRAYDLLIEKSGGSPDQPVGRIAIVNQIMLTYNKIAFSNFIHKIRVNTEQISPEYLFCFLKTMHSIKLTDSMQSQTNGIRNLIMSNYFNQHIPLPSIEKQNEIAKHIQSIRTQASNLQKEANEILENAKKKVEQMILGE